VLRYHVPTQNSRGAPDTANDATAIKLLIDPDISVDDEGDVVGVISEADLVRRAAIGTQKHRPWWLEALTPGSMLAEEFARSHGLRVSEFMSTHVSQPPKRTPLSEIAALLPEHTVRPQAFRASE
jgi:hypothetical protein